MLRRLPKSWGLAIPILSFSIREDFSDTEAQRSLSRLFSVPLRLREIQILSHIAESSRGGGAAPGVVSDDLICAVFNHTPRLRLQQFSHRVWSLTVVPQS